MSYKNRNYSGWPILLLLLLLGGIIGGWIGDALIHIWPALGTVGQMKSVGIPTFTVNLSFLSFTVGFMLHISLFTILGFALAYLVYKRL